MNLFAVALLVVVLDGCRRYRSLEEIEESLEQLEQVPVTPTADDPLLAGFERVRRMFAPGGEPIFADHQLALEAREYQDRAVELVAEGCYVFLAFGLPERFDVDLRLDRPDGLPVAEDRSPDPFPVIPTYCAPETGTYNLRVIAARRSGQVRVGGYRMPSIEDAEAARRLDRLRTRYFPDARALGPVVRRTLGEGDDYEFPIALLPGRCYAVAAVATDGVVDLDVELRDDHEEILLRDIGTDAEPVVERFCPESRGTFRLRFRMYAGSGDLAWQLFERP